MNTQKNVKTDVISTLYYQFSIFFHSQVKYSIYDASCQERHKFGALQCLAYIYFLLKHVFFLIILKLQKSPLYRKKWQMF